MEKTIPVGTRVTYGGHVRIKERSRGVVVEPTPDEVAYLRWWALPGVAVKWYDDCIPEHCPSSRELEYVEDLVRLEEEL
jgi:hypothetical protein